MKKPSNPYNPWLIKINPKQGTHKGCPYDGNNRAGRPRPYVKHYTLNSKP